MLKVYSVLPNIETCLNIAKKSQKKLEKNKNSVCCRGNVFSVQDTSHNKEVSLFIVKELLEYQKKYIWDPQKGLIHAMQRTGPHPQVKFNREQLSLVYNQIPLPVIMKLRHTS